MYICLNENNINEILELQQAVYNSLNEDEKGFLLPKSEQHILKHFADGNFVQGYVENGKLIAQSFITISPCDFPQTTHEYLEEHNLDDKAVTLLQGLVVHPDYQGMGLSSKMIHNWVNWAAENGKHTAVSEVEITNYKSYGGFLHAGLELDSITIDPVDNAEIFHVVGNPKEAMFKQAFNEAAAYKEQPENITVDAKDVYSIKDAFNNNYKAVYWDKAEKKLILTQKKDSLAMASLAI